MNNDYYTYSCEDNSKSLFYIEPVELIQISIAALQTFFPKERMSRDEEIISMVRHVAGMQLEIIEMIRQLGLDIDESIRNAFMRDVAFELSSISSQFYAVLCSVQKEDEVLKPSNDDLVLIGRLYYDLERLFFKAINYGLHVFLSVSAAMTTLIIMSRIINISNDRMRIVKKSFLDYCSLILYGVGDSLKNIMNSQYALIVKIENDLMNRDRKYVVGKKYYRSESSINVRCTEEIVLVVNGDLGSGFYESFEKGNIECRDVPGPHLPVGAIEIANDRKGIMNVNCHPIVGEFNKTRSIWVSINSKKADLERLANEIVEASNCVSKTM